VRTHGVRARPGTGPSAHRGVYARNLISSTGLGGEEADRLVYDGLPGGSCRNGAAAR